MDLIIGNKLVNTFMAGNIRGIIDKLDYIESIGFNWIYLTPIFKAPSINKYDTEDYTQIDPDFGNLYDFKYLVKEWKRKKIRIMLDGVFNHFGSIFAPWLDVLKHNEKSKYINWFIVNDFSKLKNKTWDSMEKDCSYEAFSFVPSVPGLIEKIKIWEIIFLML